MSKVKYPDKEKIRIQIDEILYSPLIRAKATALHVSEITGIPAA